MAEASDENQMAEPPTANEENDPEKQIDAAHTADDDSDWLGKSSAELLEEDIPWKERFKQVVVTYAPLGFMAFGGPQAHVAILRDHLVVRREWLDEDQFTELFALGQGLPGPTSTQLVVSTALTRAGPVGALAALFLWNLPSLIVLTTCGALISIYVDPNNPPLYLVGLPPAAVSLVAVAFYGFAQKLDKLCVILCLISSLVAILINGDERIKSTSSQIVYPGMLLVGGMVAYTDSKRSNPYGIYNTVNKGWDAQSDLILKRIGIPVWAGALMFVIWAVIVGTTVSAVTLAKRNGETVNVYLEIFEVMYRIGSLTFGYGEVILPMLQSEVVPSWVTKDQFLQGLGLAQSMPGDLFNYSSYLGTIYKGVGGGLIAYLGLFGPGVILIFGMVPFWARLRHVQWFKSALVGVNATAIGFVGAACVILWEGAVDTAADAMVLVLAGVLAMVYGIGAPYVILAGAIFGAILHEDALSLGQVEWCDLTKAGDL